MWMYIFVMVRWVSISTLLIKRKWTLFSLAVLVPVGLATKTYSGPAQFWVNNSLGGVFYVVFWSLLLSLAMPNLHRVKNVMVVFTATCAIELLQLWHPPVLQLFRSNFIGATVLGTTFTWSDFPHYAAGAFCSFLLLSVLARREGR
jgi:hypothetical protein